jgi:hypothetical protein
VELATPAAVEERRKRGGLWAAVRAEAAATYGRRRRLWSAAAVLLPVLAGAITGHSASLVFGDLVSLLGLPWWALSCWGPAWLCADLLSIRTRDNPDPLREWRPAEFWARALGRLLPFYGVFLLTAAIFAARALGDGPSGTANRMWSLGAGLSRWEEFGAWWLALTGFLVLGGLPYAALAALLSGSQRRPRRWLVAPAAVWLGSALAIALFTLISMRWGSSIQVYIWTALGWRDGLLVGLVCPNVLVVAVAAGTLDELSRALGGSRGGGLPDVLWPVTLLLILAALPAAGWVAWIARRRYRRNAGRGWIEGVAEPGEGGEAGGCCRGS